MAYSAEQAAQLARQYSGGSSPSFTPSYVPKAPTLVQKSVKVGQAGLGRIGDLLNAPSNITEKFLTAGKTYEDVARSAGVKNPLAQKIIGTAGRVVLDPLNVVSFGSEGIAKVGLKSLSEGGVRELGEAGIKKLTSLASKDGFVTLSKEAGKELARLEPTVGRRVAEEQLLKRAAQGENVVAKSGIKIGVPGAQTTIPVKIPNLATKLVPQGVKNVAENTALKFRKAFEYPLKRAPEAASNLVDKTIAKKQQYGDLADSFIKQYSKAAPDVKSLADDVLRGTVKITSHENPVVSQAITVRQAVDDLGRQAVDLGLLSEDTYKKGQGSYLPQLYDVFLQRSEDALQGNPSAKKIATDEFARLQARTETQIAEDLAKGTITPEQAQVERDVLARFQKAGGQVDNPAFQASKALQNLGGLISKTEEYKGLRQYGKSADELVPDVVSGATKVTIQKGIQNNQEQEIARHALDALQRTTAVGGKMSEQEALQSGAKQLLNFSTEVESKGQKMYKLPESKSLGDLSGIYVPEAIHTYLTEGSGRFLSSTAGKWMVRLSAPLQFKTLKTVWSPGSQVRNILSNQILGFLNDPGSFNHFKEAIDVVRKPNSPLFKEMEAVGLFNGKFFGEEVAKYYKKLDTAGDDVNLFSKFYGGLKDAFGATHNFLGNTREITETHAKIQQYLRARALGASAEQAKNVAEATLFAYNKVGPGIRIIRGSGIPFITFTVKAAPFVAKQGLKNPGRLAVFPKAEREVTNLFGVDPQEAQYLPDWMKGMIALPFKDKNGNTLYFNPKYIYPWGQMFNDFKPLPGLPLIGQGGSLPGGLSVSPTISEGISQVTGRDLFTGEEFVNEAQLPEDQLRARAERIGKTFSPGPISGAIPYIPGSTSATPSQKDRGLANTVLGSATGIQVQPFNLSRGIDSRFKAIQAIQRETSAQVNKALKEGASNEKIRRIQEQGFERIRELQGS